MKRERNSGVLPNFVKSKLPPAQVVVFPPPEVPRDFNPVHVFASDEIIKTPDPKLYEMAMVIFSSSTCDGDDS